MKYTGLIHLKLVGKSQSEFRESPRQKDPCSFWAKQTKMSAAFFLAASVFYIDKILIQGHMPELWHPQHSNFTHCVLTEVCSSRVKKLKLYLHSHNFLHSWLGWMVPQKCKGPGKGDSDLFLFTISPACVWWPCPRCVSTETLGLVEGPAISLPLALWSEADKFTVPIGGAARLLTDLGYAGKITPNNFLQSGAPNPKIVLFRKWGGVALGFISFIMQKWSDSPVK